MNNVKKLYDSKKINRFLQWEILTYYYTFKNNTIDGTSEEVKKFNITFENRKQKFTESFININDLTNDFDFPIDYDNFIKILKSYTNI